MPERMQRAQTRRLRTVPRASTVRTAWRFGRKRRFVFLFEWLTFLPVAGRLPQISQ